MRDDDGSIYHNIDQSALGPNSHLVPHRSKRQPTLDPAMRFVKLINSSTASRIIRLFFHFLPHLGDSVAKKRISIWDFVFSFSRKQIKVTNMSDIFPKFVSNSFQDSLHCVTGSNFSRSTNSCTSPLVSNYNCAAQIEGWNVITTTQRVGNNHIGKPRQIDVESRTQVRHYFEGLNFTIVIVSDSVFTKGLLSTTTHRSIRVSVHDQADRATGGMRSHSCSGGKLKSMGETTTKTTTRATVNQTNTILRQSKCCTKSSDISSGPLTWGLDHVALILIGCDLDIVGFHVEMELRSQMDSSFSHMFGFF
mmetsp:Transcript_18377/g.25434  ORF Transcript_18377/g.25434 Transcript_18377/m.25434 type:complete len:307 (-) Transcript_18377:2157-3077(-)